MFFYILILKIIMKDSSTYRKTFLFCVALYVIWLLGYYTSLNTSAEYSSFHYDNLKRLCETNYEGLNDNVRPYCNNFR